MKKKILLSAFACRPTAGSEWGVGWNFFYRLSKTYDVHLITEGEYQDEIRLACEQMGISQSKLHFIDLSGAARQRCHNQGDWRFYLDYRFWQKRAVEYAKALHRIERFSLVHHLNMIGFREPGDMWKLNIPFVLGPLGGFGDVPNVFLHDQTFYQKLKNNMKRFLNFYSMRLPHVVRAISSAQAVLVAYPEGLSKVRHYFGKEPVLLSETGCAEMRKSTQPRKNLVWVGKNVPRKQFGLAAEAFSNSDLARTESLIVVGDFSNEDKLKWKNFPNIKFKGQLSRDNVLAEMSSARALLFTSVHEGNPHVVYEALSVQTPVLCHNSYGMGHLINDKVGLKVDVKNYAFSLNSFSNAIDKLVDKKFDKEEFSKICQDNSWKGRVCQLSRVYESVLEE